VIMAVVEAVHGPKVRSRACSSVRTLKGIWCRTFRVCFGLEGLAVQRVELDAPGQPAPTGPLSACAPS